MITAILNGYKRPQALQEQIQSLKDQTVPPEEILIWYNIPEDGIDDSLLNSATAISRTNLGVWARFFYAFNARTEYVAIFDDDTIPGKKWFENCLDTMSKQEGLLGANGLRWATNNTGYNDYITRTNVGIKDPSNEIRKADIVGHAWFFKRDWLQYFVRDLPDTRGARLVSGEDMHFSYTLQKYANIPTLVPPHPEDDIEMWGSIDRNKYGMSPVAISADESNWGKFEHYFDVLKGMGWIQGR